MKYDKYRKDSWKLWIPYYGIYYGFISNEGLFSAYRYWTKGDSFRSLMAGIYHALLVTIPVIQLFKTVFN